MYSTTIVIDQEENPKGTKNFGAIPCELRQLNFTKIFDEKDENKYLCQL